MRISKALLLTVTTLVFSSVGAIAQIYDLTSALISGQPTPGNPLGVFRFGQYTTGVDPESFSLFTIFDESDAGGIDRFRGSAIDPNVLFNDTPNVVVASGITLDPDDVAFGPSGGPTVLRFTAPTTGIYQIDANFLGIQTGNSAALAMVFHNSTSLFSETADTTDGATYSGTLSLIANDTVDFVAVGANQGGGDKHTQVLATLTVVPEPATIGLVALGAAFLLTARRRTLSV